MPSLLGFRDPTERLRGVLGLRAAAAMPLYLEHYLDQPVENAIAGATGKLLRRSDIVEVGNLAAGNCRGAVRMIAELPAYLLARDFSWIVFTATRTVRQILLGFGAPLVELARADGARVAGGVDAWGGYYDNDPRVFAGYLPESWRLAAFTRGSRIISALADALRRAPRGRIALQEGQRSLTYGELGSQVAAERRWLRDGGGERFALLADNGLGWAVADLPCISTAHCRSGCRPTSPWRSACTLSTMPASTAC